MLDIKRGMEVFGHASELYCMDHGVGARSVEGEEDGLRSACCAWRACHIEVGSISRRVDVE